MKRKVILVLGKTGQGKSYFTKKIIERAKRVIILDPLLEYKDGKIFTSLHSLISYLRNDPPVFRCICRFSTDDENDLIFPFVWGLHDLLFVVEETEIYINPRSSHQGLMRLINYGRHKNIHLLCIARRLNEINTSFRAQITTLVTFRQDFPGDLKVLEDFEIDTEKVKRLNVGEYEFTRENPEAITF